MQRVVGCLVVERRLLTNHPQEEDILLLGGGARLDVGDEQEILTRHTEEALKSLSRARVSHVRAPTVGCLPELVRLNVFNCFDFVLFLST